MNKKTGKCVFGAIAVVVFFGVMYLISNGVVDLAVLSSIPIILCAETIVLGMLYATIFHSEPEEITATLLIETVTESTNPVVPRIPDAKYLEPDVLRVLHEHQNKKVQPNILSAPNQMVKS